MRRLRFLAACLVLAVALLAPAPAPADARTSGPSIRPDNRPTPLARAENGEVPPDRLVTVAPGCRVAREAGPSLALLFRLASASGVGLGTRDCYRPVNEQVAVQGAWTARGNSACAATPQRHPDGRPKGTSTHGWGKATDFSNAGGAMTFTSTGYRFLKSWAARLGWNHPGWAEPGGSTCPEPWHWEWVGDGGTTGGTPVRADVVALLPGPGDDGHLAVTGLGAVQPTGAARSAGSAEAVPLNWVIVSAAGTPDRAGYWLLGGDGGIFTYGTARFHGSTGAMRLNSPIVGMAAAPDGAGYWLVAADGGVFTFGSARFHGSTGAMRLNSPIVGMAAAPDGAGYWLVAADGGVFTFGRAPFHGSAADRGLVAPTVALVPAGGDAGYWLVAADGTVVTRGKAEHFG